MTFQTLNGFGYLVELTLSSEYSEKETKMNF